MEQYEKELVRFRLNALLFFVCKESLSKCQERLWMEKPGFEHVFKVPHISIHSILFLLHFFPYERMVQCVDNGNGRLLQFYHYTTLEIQVGEPICNVSSNVKNNSSFIMSWKKLCQETVSWNNAVNAIWLWIGHTLWLPKSIQLGPTCCSCSLSATVSFIALLFQRFRCVPSDY